MILNLNDLAVNVLLGAGKVAAPQKAQLHQSFSNEIMAELSELGHFLMKNAREYPDIVATGYWLRAAHLKKIKADYTIDNATLGSRKSKGVVFHIAPGNVDTLFFYSLVLSLLTGNQSILRISNRLSDIAEQLILLLKQFFTKKQLITPVKHSVLYPLINIIQYPHNDDITAEISLQSDVRVIWGGDKTVSHIATLPMKEHGTQVSFPDRYSVSVIQLENEYQIQSAVLKFVADIKPFMQQACSSPKVVYWLNTNEHLQVLFWQMADKLLSEQLPASPLSASEQIELILFKQNCAIELAPVLQSLSSQTMQNLNCISVIPSARGEKFTKSLIDKHCGLFCFLSQDIEELFSIKLEKHCQTITKFGVIESDWHAWIEKSEQPMKRWAKLGTALDFSPHWDGVDIISSLTTG